ncbi:uncharacterized protein LOC111328972 [Stylophora pistillata]|uniref:uncharacterized protein LOC111328972 n=1 Tax=Stylophora pistillata TaxID=50429 RepID=UPI000C04D6CE|nr:uncharacterized protein LOC111328972 [Stylophora pistillata]
MSVIENKRRFYLVDGGPIRHVGAGGTEENRIKALTTLQLAKPYYQYLLCTLTSLAKIPNSTGVKLDGAIVTHPHADHLDGVERLFRELLPNEYQQSVTSANPDKRLVCNGPVLLTKKFVQDKKAYRSFSEFLLKTKFKISLDIDDIQNAFGNDIIFSFPTSPGVLYQRHNNDEPHSEEEQRSKLKEGTEDDDLNKSSIILFTKEGGKICLSGDAYGHDIVAMLRSHGAKDLDIFKLPHHGSPENSILGKVMPPTWASQNLAAMVLLSLSLNRKIVFEKNPEEERDIDYVRRKLIRTSKMGNGETVQRIAETFQGVIKKQLKNTTKETLEELFHRVKAKHLEVVAALQQQSGCVDPCKNLEALNSLANWKNLTKSVADKLGFSSVSTDLKRRKVDWWRQVEGLMGHDKSFRDYFADKIGIEGFFDSFHSKTYYVSASGRYGHPSPDVIKGIIKAAVKKNKPCRIVFTSGGDVPSAYLPDVNVKPYEQWKKLVSLYYLKNNVSFKLDPNEDVNTAPTGTSKFENDDRIRIDVSQRLKDNVGFTIPRRSFLPNVDQFYIKTKGSDEKFLWLEVKNDGQLFLTPKKGAQNILNVSNAPSITSDFNVITLQGESETGYQVEQNVWLENATGGGFLIKESPKGKYFLEDNGSLKRTNKRSKGSSFFFDHRTFSGPLKDETWVSFKAFLKSRGSKSDQKSINVRSALELLLGLSNVERLKEEVPPGSIACEALDNEVDMELSMVELSSSMDSEVISSKIQVVTKLRPMTFDASPVTTLEIVVKDPCSRPDMSLRITTSLGFANYTLRVSEHMKPKEPSVDMYLNALGGVPLENRDNLTLGTILQRVAGYLPLEALAKGFPTQLLALDIFTWKVDRLLSTVNYFTSPLAVEVLTGDFYLIIPTEKNQVTLGGTLVIDLSQFHVTVKKPRTERSDFVVECEATIGTIAVNLRMVPTSTAVPEVIISFSHDANFLSVVKMLDPQVNIQELAVPLLNKVIQDLQLSNPTIRVVQDIQSYYVTQVSSLTFGFTLENFASILPSGFSSPQGSQATVTIFNPLSSHPQVGFEVQFKLAVATSTDANAFLDSKFSLWPVDASNHQNSQGYTCSVSLCPNLSEISIQSALEAVGLGQQMTSIMSFFPFMENILNAILLDKISLDVNYQKRAIESFSLSLFVPQCSIIEEKFTMQDASFLVQYGCHQWYAETEMKLLVFNKFTCRAAFSLPGSDVPGTLTFENEDDSFTLQQFLEGIGFSVSHNVPIIDEISDVTVSRAAISFENNGSTFKLSKIEAVLRKRTLTIGSISLYNLEVTVRFSNVRGGSAVSLSLRGYLNPTTYATLTFDTERQELLGHYVLVDNMSTDECLDRLFPRQMEDCSGSNAYIQVKSLHVQEVRVILSFSSEEQWHVRNVRVRLDGCLTLGPFILHQLCLIYMTELPGNATQRVSVVGHFKSNEQTLSFMVELSSTSQESNSTILEAVIKPDSHGGLTLSSLLGIVGLKSTEDEVPQVDGSPDFLNIGLKEARLQFEASPFRIRKMDVVVKTRATITILETPLIQLNEARLEYHLDKTKDPVHAEIFIAGILSIGKLPLNVTFKRDTQLGLVLEGLFNEADGSTKVDFEEMANLISPDVPFSLPRSVTLSSFLFRLEKVEESISLKLEGESQSKWTTDVGISTLTVHNLGGKVHFTRQRSSSTWRGSVCLNGKVLVQGTLDVAVEVYHDGKGETVVFGTVQNPAYIDLDILTKSFATGSDPSNSWKGLLPNGTDATVRFPSFTKAYLSVNVSKRILMFFGAVAGFGTGSLIVKQAASGENSSKYGFLFGLSLGNDFRFSSINESLNVVDEVILVQNANLCVISKEFEQVKVAEMLEEIYKLEVFRNKQLVADVPFTNLDSQ